MTPFAERFFNAREKDVEASSCDRVGAGGGEADGAQSTGSVPPYTVDPGGTAESKGRACFCTPYVAQQIRDEKDRLRTKNFELHARAQQAEAELVLLHKVGNAGMDLISEWSVEKDDKFRKLLLQWHRRWVQNDET